MNINNSSSIKKLDIDCVIIGVNAESTLEECIQSVLKSNYTEGNITIYYVDGGSSDQSLMIARNFQQVHVVEINPEYPTPGMGRNCGWKAGKAPLVQFLDSDTILDVNWFSKSVESLTDKIGAIRGNRVEKNPELSTFNWIANLEWNAPPGECEAFGGDVLIRRSVLEATDGYDEVLVGGEDPELSQRVRLNRWKITQLNELMTKHDLAMTRISQYWKRAYRTGYGYAAVTTKHATKAKGFWFYEFNRIIIRGGFSLLLILLAFSGLAIDRLNQGSLILLIPAFLLVLYPRLFRVNYFMKDKKLSRESSKKYAWHCSLIVIPEFIGIVRYLITILSGIPLRNKRNLLKTSISSIANLLIITLLISLTSCSDFQTTKISDHESKKRFSTEKQRGDARYAEPDMIKKLSQNLPEEYLLGPGDVLSVKIWNRPEISDENIIIGPDGIINIARIGNINVSARSREDVAGEITEKLSLFYDNPEVSLAVKVYKNNKAFVLGRVANPGVVTFPGKGTLLEALSLAGGLPVSEEQTFLTKCAIIRGKEAIIWINLNELLYNGNMTLNAKIRNNDVIFIPESDAELVYVMGEVVKPGAIRLRSRLTYLDALMMSGGPTKIAKLKKTYLIRSNETGESVTEINLSEMIKKGATAKNYILQDNDIIYVDEKGSSKLNYVFKQITPALDIFESTSSSLETFGVMQELRKSIFNQEGFTGD